MGHQPRPPLSLQRYTHPQPKPENNLQGVYLHLHIIYPIYLGGGDRVVPVRGGVHALPHLLHPARLPGQGRGRQNIT